MTILIGNISKDEEIKYNLFEYMNVSKICDLDRNNKFDVYIMNTNISDFGLIRNTDIILDYLLITYNICKLFYKLENSNYLINACFYYNVECYELK